MLLKIGQPEYPITYLRGPSARANYRQTFSRLIKRDPALIREVMGDAVAVSADNWDTVCAALVGEPKMRVAPPAAITAGPGAAIGMDDHSKGVKRGASSDEDDEVKRISRGDYGQGQTAEPPPYPRYSDAQCAQNYGGRERRGQGKKEGGRGGY